MHHEVLIHCHLWNEGTVVSRDRVASPLVPQPCLIIRLHFYYRPIAEGYAEQEGRMRLFSILKAQDISISTISRFFRR